MKTKLCWIPFIPIAIAMIVLKYIETTLPQGETFLGLEGTGLIYTVIVLVPVLFALCIIISLFDKKISPYYALSKNIAAAIFGFIAGVAVIFEGVMSVMNSLSGTVGAFELITSIVGIVAGVGLLFMASAHLSGKNCGSSLSLFILFPALWAGLKLVCAFLTYRTVSVLSADMLDLICYALMALFFCADAMMLGNIESKNSVKKCFVTGLTLAASLFAYCTKTLVLVVTNAGAYEITDYAKLILMFAVGLYALFVLIELSLKAKTRDEVEIVIGEGETVAEEHTTVREKVDFLDDEAEDKKIEAGSFMSTAEAETVKEDETEPQDIPEDNTLPEREPQETSHPEIKESDFVVAPSRDNGNELQNRMDEIDKLIYEIQSKNED